MNGAITIEEAYHISNILKHYSHAMEKHPYFCDTLDGYGRTKFPGCNSQTLEYERHCISKDIEAGDLAWHQLLTCEMWEVFDALSYGDKTQAVEELYDCIAVCLRTIDVLEGRQELGKPETKGEVK